MNKSRSSSKVSPKSEKTKEHKLKSQHQKAVAHVSKNKQKSESPKETPNHTNSVSRSQKKNSIPDSNDDHKIPRPNDSTLTTKAQGKNASEFTSSSDNQHLNPAKNENSDKKVKSRPNSAAISKHIERMNSAHSNSSRVLHKNVPYLSKLSSSSNIKSSSVANTPSSLKQSNSNLNHKHMQAIKKDAKRRNSVQDKRTNTINSVRNPAAVKDGVQKTQHGITAVKEQRNEKKPSTLQRDRYLEKRRKSSKGLPPTAVVSPIQDKSKSSAVNTQKSVDDVALEKKLNSAVITNKSGQKDFSTYNSTRKSVSYPNLSVLDPSTDESSADESDNSTVEISNENVEPQIPFELGHYFQAHELKEWVNWCDACGGVIVSLFGASVTCAKCNMICHRKCALGVSLTCAADDNLQSQTLPEVLNRFNTVVEETKDEATLKEYNTIKRVISLEEVQERINKFNLTVKGIQQMTLQEDGETFRGFVRVTMNLIRPVSVSHHPLSKLQRKLSDKQQHKASFYVDKGAVKALHITSDTTAEQVVRMLLHKYNITDNPMKFALFERQAREEEHVILRKMLPRERPLLLRLLWGNENVDKREFILQENESRDIEWEAFSVAELQMFIKILDKEENDYVNDIKRKYEDKAHDIKEAMDYQNRLATPPEKAIS